MGFGAGLADQYRNQPPAAPAAAPAALPQPEVDYMGLFQGALGASRAGVERQITSALGDIASREGIANQAVGQLPGQLSSIYQQGDANIMRTAAGLEDAQKASGLHSFMSAGAQLAPIAMSRTNDLASRQADVPLLRLATQTEFNRQRGVVEQARAAAASDQQGQLASFYGQMAQAQASRGYDLADTASERTYQDRVRKDEQDFQLKLNGLSGKNLDDATGLTKGRVTELQNSPRYKDAVESMKDTKHSKGALWWRKTSGHKAATAEDIVKKYRAYPQLLKVLARDFPDVAAYIAGGDFSGITK